MFTASLIIHKSKKPKAAEVSVGMGMITRTRRWPRNEDCGPENAEIIIQELLSMEPALPGVCMSEATYSSQSSYK